MECIGLLGLLGLIGFFFGRGIEQKFENFKKEVRRGNNNNNLETRIAENEKNISDLQRELGRINSALQNFVTFNDFDKFSRQIQITLQELEKKISVSISKVSESENKISAEDLRQLQSTLKNFQTKLDEVQNANKKFDTRLNTLESSKISALEKKISELNSVLVQYQNYFVQVQNNLNNLQKKFIADNEPTPKPIISTPKPAQVIPPDIRDFQIKNLHTPLFTNNPGDTAKSISVIENLSGLTAFLENSNFDKKESFIRLIKNYQQNLQKFTDKIKRGKFNEDNFSEEVSEAFFDTLSKYFLATVPVSIYRGRKENPKFYSEFLARINSYLAACHVYTELIEPKKFMKPDDVEKMSIVKKDTAIKSNDKIIDEVERLPYFLDYITEDNELEHYCFEGKMVVLKFDGGK